MTPARAQRRTPPGPARAPIHVQSRPAPGTEPTTAPDPAADVLADVLAEARSRLATAHKPGCRCSTWCRDDWTYFGHAIGPCTVCGEPCRSTDPAGNMRHPTGGCEARTA